MTSLWPRIRPLLACVARTQWLAFVARVGRSLGDGKAGPVLARPSSPDVPPAAPPAGRAGDDGTAAGGVSGRGVFKGSQTNLSFVPEQHTDFIFTAVAEELGFLGAATLLALFALVVWRTWRTAVLARDRFGSLLCVGVLAMLAVQIFENVGMTMGITPIAGIPLPFMSYGGSSTVAGFIAMGLVLNVHMRRFS